MLVGFGSKCMNCGWPEKEGIHQWVTDKKLEVIDRKLDDILTQIKIRG